MDDTISVADLAQAIGLPDTATKDDVLAKLKTFFSEEKGEPQHTKTLSVADASGNVTTLSASDLLTRLTALEAKTAAPAKTQTAAPAVQTFSVTSGGKTITLSASDLATKLITLEAKLAATEQSAAQSSKSAILTALSAAGKAPVNPATGKPFSAAELEALDIPTLTILSANTPVTVPLTARGSIRTDAAKDDPALKGLSRVQAFYEAQHQ